MSEKRAALVAGVVVLMISIIFSFIMLRQSPVEPPAVYGRLTIEDCIVDVSALYKGQRRYGKGIVVEKNGETFILTSSMIFVDSFESISVGVGGWTASAGLIHSNKVWGLAGLVTYPGYNEGWPISDAPNIPPNTESTTTDGEWTELVQVRDYINDDWFLIAPANEDYVGAPLVNGGEITGIIVGLNQVNTEQAIAVGNRAIKEFCDQVLRMNGLIIPDDAPPVFHPDMSEKQL